MVNRMQSTYKVPHIYSEIKNKKVNEPVVINVPGSKSITNRALLLATLADGKSTLRGVLFSEDSRHFLKCIQELGFETTVDEQARVITVKGNGGEVPLKEAAQYVGSAGTAARFLTAYLGVSQGTYYMDASEQMRKRPMEPLLDSLKELGCEVIYGTNIPKEKDASNEDIVNTQMSRAKAAGMDDRDYVEGHFPFTLRGHGFGKNVISINIDNSSQFLSALLIASCLSKEDFTIKVEGTHGMSYIEMTCKMMQQFGVKAQRMENGYPVDDENAGTDGMACNARQNMAKIESISAPTISYVTKAGQKYKPMDYSVEPDVSAACYFYAMTPLLNIPVMVENVHFNSLQGDVKFIHVLEKMGCKVEDTEKGITVYPPENGEFMGVEVDMSSFSDQAITLAAIAPFAQTSTKITGIGHIRLQESDRIKAIVTELSKLGVHCKETQDSITIYPSTPKAGIVETYDDHRMAMGFSLIGLRTDGVEIDNPLCCKKTFENYFEVLDKTVDKIRS